MTVVAVRRGGGGGVKVSIIKLTLTFPSQILMTVPTALLSWFSAFQSGPESTD